MMKGLMPVRRVDGLWRGYGQSMGDPSREVKGFELNTSWSVDTESLNEAERGIMLV